MFISSVNHIGNKREKFLDIIFFIFFLELSWMHFISKDRIFAYFLFSGVGKLIQAGLSYR
jgi:hypothetical protein